ncbi:MAG: iron ABC transporter permease [Candidatus Bathyarchaeota archaeon]|nr:iron ABC transporter permease [Candidatus Bathyarchaeota archaeon]
MIFFGRVSLNPIEVLTGTLSQKQLIILTLVRIPRVIISMCVGAALSVSGVSLQGVSRNPLVGPEILGVSAGAGFGAACAILFFEGVVPVQVFAFTFGLTAVMLTFLVSKAIKNQGNSVIVLILSGIAVSAVFSAALGIMKYVADPYEKLPEIVFWLLGSFSAVSWSDILNVVPMLVGIVTIVLLRWRVNILSLGEEEAKTLGVNYGITRTVLLMAATLATAASVACCGIISWVGLIVPHITRRIVGSDHKILIPATLSVGAVFMVVCDGLARTLYTFEVPIGIITSLVGAPVFILLLKFGDKKKW